MTQSKHKSNPSNMTVTQSAWAQYTELNKSYSVDDLYAEGWISKYDFAKLVGLTPCAAPNRAKNDGLIVKKFRVLWGNVSREVLFVKQPTKSP